MSNLRTSSSSLPELFSETSQHASTAPCLTTPFTAGVLDLRHRVVMESMLRLRTLPETEAPRDIDAIYYEQRASRGGLIVSESLAVSRVGRGYFRAPSAYTPEQVEAWRPVVERVKTRGCSFFAQLLHAGRLTHSDLTGGGPPVAPSAVRAEGRLQVDYGVEKPYDAPTPLQAAGIFGIVDQYVAAARALVGLGFDGVEINGGNGYLPHQFLASKTNTRTDVYGGSVRNRARFLLQVLDAVATEVGAERVAVKLQPGVTFGDIVESEQEVSEQLHYLAPQLSHRQLAYVQLSSLNFSPYYQALGLPAPNLTFDPFRTFRAAGYAAPLVVSGALTPAAADTYITEATADLAAFATLFIANANLPQLLAAGMPLNPAGSDPAAWFSRGPEDDARGYIDWPLVRPQAPSLLP